MLKFGYYFVISTLLVLTSQEDAANQNYSMASDTQENLADIVLNVNAGGKRRTPIWFAIPRESLLLNTTEEYECGDSADDFPNFFTYEQRINGAIVIHFIVCTYCFILIAIICDQYFLPCVERICESLSLSEDVAAATFMSFATSAPELFVNIIGTFVTSSDIGIGTIVGSSMFNTIAVASIGGLAASAPIKIAWWPVTRDIIIYIFSVSFLVMITWDGLVFWYEALILFCGYILYFLIMIQNNRISKFAHLIVERFQKKKVEGEKVPPRSSEKSIQSVSTISSCMLEKPRSKYSQKWDDYENDIHSVYFEIDYSIYQMPKGGRFGKVFFIISWPIRFLLYYTIPDCKRYPKIFPLTFVTCIMWIGLNSYVVSWVMTIMGSTFGIPDAVLGMTLMAVGGCLPESFSIAILSRKGQGKMGVSNALGANTMNILLSLGFPWFIKTVTSKTEDTSFIYIESGSLEYTILGLIVVAITLYVSLIFTNFHLSRRSGFIMITLYFGFLSLAIVADLVLFKGVCIS